MSDMNDSGLKWDTLHRTQDGGYWIPAEDQTPVHAFHFCGKCGMTVASCPCSRGNVPNPYGGLTSEPAKPEKQWTDREREQGKSVASAIVAQALGRPVPRGGE